ncbi:MAG: RNA polymerase sigma factor [Candidatus Krumholzibacteriota bacterium]|nr:RNA polymerase sigma factor [Candidatus Krumholzibacteriota bacterium]
MRGDLDPGLVKRAANGDGRAFEEIIEEHHSLVWASVRAVMGDRLDVEDTVQEVFIKVYRGLPSFRGGSRLSTWIYRIARNEALNAVSRKVHETLPIEIVERIEDPGERPDRAVGRAETAAGLERFLARIEERWRTAIELRYMGERSYAEIADIMELPVGTVKTYIHRGKTALRRMMVDESPGRSGKQT